MSLIRHAARLLPAIVALLMAAVPADVSPRVHAAGFENNPIGVTGGDHGRWRWNAAHPAATLEEAESDHKAEQLVRLIAGLLAVTGGAAPSFVPAAAPMPAASVPPRRILSAHRSTGPPAV